MSAAKAKPRVFHKTEVVLTLLTPEPIDPNPSLSDLVGVFDDPHPGELAGLKFVQLNKKLQLTRRELRGEAVSAGLPAKDASEAWDILDETQADED